MSQMALYRFEQARAATLSTGVNPRKEPDFSAWSEKRIRAYKVALSTHTQVPLAVLRIERIHLEVPVFNGTDDWILDLGAGRIAGTAAPGEKGNLAIAGHRDGYFRSLRNVEVGDAVELITMRSSSAYVVDAIRIVDPFAVEVLENGSQPALTLVTCYPFYFVGDAPWRYILHCSLRGQGL